MFTLKQRRYVVYIDSLGVIDQPPLEAAVMWSSFC